ncbi:Tat pathway signal sequence domain protein [Croceibacterium mercuriale]|uniref:Tat pathway signal sequence domain protein n=1 Tax=Croceibacterium mercuriale TaxID=1572751 RepID=A0A0B2BY75_9SPHN|nr:DUF6250 domain-containing protein [Croceibacterium mercuriale]KHL24765.1 Tat pathway signal sequence domain protein [Croceibacterium mercuriale]
MGEIGRRRVLAGIGATLLAGGCVHGRRDPVLLHSDDFRHGLDQWLVEAEQPAQVSAADGVLDIAAPAGITLWFRPELSGPVAIDYTVTAISAGGPLDQVSDVNAFWMATDTRAATGNVLDVPRSGAFTDYDRLRMYYVGIGGNRNTTTRLRRYVGRDGDRPLLPEHDRTDPAAMIVPNQPIRIRLIADGPHIAVLRDGAPVFTMRDPAPYTRGHFGLRTTWSHLAVRDFAVWRL